MIRTFHITLLFFAIPMVMQAQWLEISRDEMLQVIAKMNESLSPKQAISIKTTHLLYDQPDTQVVAHRFEGEIRSLPEGLYNLRQIGQLVVQDQHLQLTIDSSKKSVVLKPNDSELLQRDMAMQQKYFLGGTCRVYTKKETGQQMYQILFPENQKYSSIEMTLNDNHELLHYVLIAGQEIMDDSGPKIRYLRPKMEITYHHYERDPNRVKANWIKPEDIIQISDGECSLKAPYQEYQLIDLRLK